ncbi:ATP-binding cassette sub- G member 1 [Irineochytrium annulatum]|nr:ATP-binding cassette sub- G member 1 [Irineochytrium annulatum]
MLETQNPVEEVEMTEIESAVVAVADVIAAEAVGVAASIDGVLESPSALPASADALASAPVPPTDVSGSEKAQFLSGASEKKSVVLSMESVRSTKPGDCQIIFKDLTYSVLVTKKEKKEKIVTEKIILNNISGEFKPGRFTAIMGASGAGKTSFLNVIAGEAKSGTVKGQIIVNGVEMVGRGMKDISGFVFQDDVVLASMTVREAIEMSATLRLPKSMSAEDRKRRVDEVIQELNLNKCVDTIIGDAMQKGVSGGERKRCAMAMEMVTNPSVLFLDEPTSGLDTFTAFAVIKSLRELCHNRGQTIVATLHQPSSEIFHLFDDLLLLSEGRIMYQGPAHKAVPYFSREGYPCPKRSNPADYFFYHILNTNEGAVMPTADASAVSDLDKLSKKPRQHHPEDETNQGRIQRLLGAWEKSDENSAVLERVKDPLSGGIPDASRKSRPTFLTQTNFLMRREALDTFRNPMELRAKMGQTLVISLIVGLLYLKNGNLTEGQLIQNMNGVLFFLSINNVFMNAQAYLSSFGRQKSVFEREYGAGYYGLVSFFISKVLVILPNTIVFPWISVTVIYFMAGMSSEVWRYFVLVAIICMAAISGFALGICLACTFSSLPIALIAAPLILMPLMLFSGLFINSASIPIWLRWIKYLSPMKYAFEGAVRSQLQGSKLGDEVISSMFNDESLSYGDCSLILVLMIFILLALAFFNLYLLATEASRVVDYA